MNLRERIRLRLARRRRQIRAWRRGFSLRKVRDLTPTLSADAILMVVVVRNEAPRLQFFFDHHRAMGVDHILMIDNGSTDGGDDLALAREDVSLWRAKGSYRRAHFGVDWVNALLARKARARWVLALDPDEFLVYPHCDARNLRALTAHLDDQGRESLGALMIDLYGRHGPAETPCPPGADPIAAAPWFDGRNHVIRRDPFTHALWTRGGPRLHALFAEAPDKAPALNKIPLVRWRRGTVFASSTHHLLPRRLNRVYATEGPPELCAALLHTKFIDTLPDKAAEEVRRREHYQGGREYDAYAGTKGFWSEHSIRYEDWRQLEKLSLIHRGDWV